MIAPPVHQQVFVNETAIFNCVGAGSYISVAWRVNDSLSCGMGNCNHQGLSLREVVVDKAGFTMINSTLVISISRFYLNTSNALLIVQCIVQQTLPEELNLQSNGTLEFSTTLTINPGKYCTC